VGKRSGISPRGISTGSGGGATLNTYSSLARISNTSIASLCGLKYRMVWAREFSESAIFREYKKNREKGRQDVSEKAEQPAVQREEINASRDSRI
jgi:NMD protein affecting ribosome stability and mRNA decay